MNTTQVPRGETLAQLRHRLIRDAAYALYVQRGYVDGYDVADWLEAEAYVDRSLVASAQGPEARPNEP